MKKLQRMCAALSLAIALAMSVSAGEIQTGIVTPPPPPPHTASPVAQTDPGTSSVASNASPVDPITNVAVYLLNLLFY